MSQFLGELGDNYPALSQLRVQFYGDLSHGRSSAGDRSRAGMWTLSLHPLGLTVRLTLPHHQCDLRCAACHRARGGACRTADAAGLRLVGESECWIGVEETG